MQQGRQDGFRVRLVKAAPWSLLEWIDVFYAKAVAGC